MTRFALLVVGMALVGVTGCAQCDTCDDFPAPCTGPNCGQNNYAPTGFIPPTQDGLPANAAQESGNRDDAAPPMGNTPNEGAPSTPSPTMPPTADPSPVSPPIPGQP